MTVQELLDLLETCEPEAEVRIAIQPSYPLESALAGITLSADIEDDAADEDVCAYCGKIERNCHCSDGENAAGSGVVYLCEGGQIGYAPRGIWDAKRRY